MALVSDLNTVPVSGYLHIDALLDQGPDWNYLTPYSNTILYTFSVASGNEPGQAGQVAFSAAQQQHTVAAMKYVSQLTGINFVLTGDGNAAQVHFANTDITYSAQTSGLSSWRSSYGYDRSGNDVLRGDGGNDTLNGQGGIDSAAFGAGRANFTVVRSGDTVTVRDNAGAGGIDTLVNVERIKFGDVALAVDIDGHGGEAYRIYQAAFDRAPDMSGVGFWMARLDQGMSLESVASGFMASAEFQAMYGANPSNRQFVEKLYQNVLDRAGEAAGVDFWVGALDHNNASRADVLAHFSESAENADNVAAVIGNGFAYVPFA